MSYSTLYSQWPVIGLSRAYGNTVYINDQFVKTLVCLVIGSIFLSSGRNWDKKKKREQVSIECVHLATKYFYLVYLGCGIGIIMTILWHKECVICPRKWPTLNVSPKFLLAS